MSEFTPDASQRAALDAIAAWHAGAAQARRAALAGGHGMAGRVCRKGESCGAAEYAHTHGWLPAGFPVLSCGGLAGSGKTSLIRAIPGELGIKVVFGTPTHKAAAVLRSKMAPGSGNNVQTLHSLIYHPVVSARCTRSGGKVKDMSGCLCGGSDCECPRRWAPCPRAKSHGGECTVQEDLTFKKREFVAGIADLLVMDESSMLTNDQVDDLCSFGLPVLLAGDHGQLPPVKAVMNKYMANPEMVLEENHRQAEDSGIVAAALAVRQNGKLPLGQHGEGVAVVGIGHPGLETLMSVERFPPGPQRAIIVWTNRLRSQVNKVFHGEGGLRPGERVISLQRMQAPAVTHNGMGWSPARTVWVHNNTVGRVAAVLPSAKGAIVPMVIELDSEFQSPGVRYVMVSAAQAQFGAERTLVQGAYPRGSHLWDYAYAITAHRAQGSEFGDVIVFDESASDWRRWLYTSMTRARERLLVIKCK